MISSKILLKLFIIALFSLNFTLLSDDNESIKDYENGQKLFIDGNYNSAAKKFVDAEVVAESPVIKANALKAQIAAYKMAKLYYKEFQAIEKLLNNYPENADFISLVAREYELGEYFYKGFREPAYWALRALPWLNGPDKSVEIFQKALERAPFDKNAPTARLRLAYLLDKEGKVKESLVQLRKIISEFPESTECKYAYLALANGLYNLSKVGDGDGQYSREALEYFKLFQKKYPNSSESEWVNTHILKMKDIQAKRLYDMANYYKDNGEKKTASRYYAELLQKYPDSLLAQNAEKKLVDIDNTFIPGDFKELPKSRIEIYKTYELPKEAEPLLITPNESDGKYLLPVFDLRLDATKSIEKEVEAK